MKLHLPHGLRKALLACLAALASLAPLALTSASGSLFTGALAWSLITPPVQATALTWKGGDGATWKTEDSSNWWISDGGDTGNANFSEGDEVTFSIGQLTDPQTVTLGSAVTAGSITLDGGAWAFSNGSNDSFALTLAGNITLSGTATSGDFSAVSVTLSGTGVQTFTGPGTITFGAITGNSHGLTIGGGTDAATVVKLTGTGAAADDHSFGAVEVKENSKLVVSIDGANDAWGSAANGANYVYGGGTVVITGNNGAQSKSDILTRLFSADPTEGGALARLELGDGTNDNGTYLWVPNSGGISNADLLRRLTTISVTAGSTLLLDGANPFDSGNDTHAAQNDHFIELAGGGSKGLTSTLHANGTSYVSWAVKLMDDNVHLGSNHNTNLYLYGKFLTGGRTFTVSGSSNVHLLGEIDYGSDLVQGLKVVMSGSGNRALYLGSNGTAKQGTIAELRGGSGSVNNLYAEAESTWTLNSIVTNNTGFMFGGAGTWNLAEDLIKNMQGGGAITLGDGTNATKFTGTVLIPSAGCGKWVISDNADVSEFALKLEGFRLTADDTKDPFWSYELQGAIDCPLSLLKPEDGDGTLGDDQTFGRSTDGKLVIQSTNANLPTENLSFSTGSINWNTAKQIHTSADAAINVNYDDADQGDYNGEGVTFVSENTGLTTVDLSGSTVQHLKLQRTAGVSGDAKVTINSLPTNLTALWLNWETSGAGVSAFTFDENATLPTNLADIYVSGTGLYLNQKGEGKQTAAPFPNITIHLGKVDKRVYGLSSDLGLQKLALWTTVNTTIKGLEMQESALVAVTSGMAFNVGTLTGSGDLRLAAAGGGASLVVTEGGNFKGHIDFVFQTHRSRKLTVKIADGQTLTTAGIASTNNNDGNEALGYGGGGFAVQDGGTSATVKVLGSNPDAALGITFGDGVTLEIAAGASQAFGGYHVEAEDSEPKVDVDTEIWKLTGAGALGVTGNVTVKALDNYTGDVHLWGGGALTVGVAGSDDAASTSLGTLSKLVLRDGESTLNVHGAWTLQGLERMEGTKLTIGSGVTGDKLTFGSGEGVALGGGLILSLGNGVTYAGKLTIDVGDTSGTGKIELGEGLQDLGSLAIGLTGLSDKGADWEGLSLFTVSGGSSNLDDALRQMLESHLTSDNEQLQLKVDGTGKVTLVALSALRWTAEGGDNAWQESGGGNVWTPQDGGAAGPYVSGANVIFEAIGDVAIQNVNVSGTVHADNITVGSEAKAAQYTFNAQGDSATIDVTGNLYLLAAEADEISSSATFNTAVNLNKAGGTSITGKGTVTFAGAGAVTASGLVVGEGVTVEVSTSGTKNFGDIEVQGGGRFVVQATNNWVANGNIANGNKVHGDGTLVLDVGSGLGHNFFATFIDGTAEAATLGSLELASGTGLTIGSSSNSIPEMLGKCTNIWVQNGAGLSINAPAMGSTGVTLHLAGNGATTLGSEGEMAGQDDGKLAAEAAFSVRNYGWDNGSHKNNNTNPWTCNWNIVLEEEASIAMGAVSNAENPDGADVSSLNLTVAGTFDAGTHTLTKLGNAILIFSHMQTGAERAGAVTINGGTLEISGLAEGATDKLVATTVDLNNADGDGTGTFKVSGAESTYTVQKVILGDGEEATDKASLTSAAVVEVGEGTTLTVEGDSGTSLDFTGGAGKIKGPGTVGLSGAVTGTGAMGIDGATVEANAAWDGYTGGLYLENMGSLKLGADVKVGYLGGTEEGYGGTITVVDGDGEHTFTLVTGGGRAAGVTVEENVKLMLTMEEGGQTLMGSYLYGSIDIGTGAELIFDGASGSDETSASFIMQEDKSLSGAGKLVVQGGSETAAALTWVGDSTNFTGTLVFGTQAGSSFLALGSDMTVGNIEMVGAGTVNLFEGVEGAKLTLNYTGTDKSVIADSAEKKLTLGTGVTFEKAGSGEVEVHFLEGEKVLVSGGKLIAHVDAEGGWNVGRAEVADGAEFNVAAGTVVLNGLAGSGKVTVETDAGLTVNEELTGYTGTVTLNGGTFTGKTGEGQILEVVLGADGSTLEGKEGGLTATLSGDDAGSRTLTAKGELTLSGEGNHIGTLQVDGTLTVDGELTLGGKMSVGASGTIVAAAGGGGTLKLTMPGDAESEGVITWNNKGATWDSNLKIDLEGTGVEGVTAENYKEWGYHLFGSLTGLEDFETFEKNVRDALLPKLSGDLPHLRYVLDQDTGMLGVGADADAVLTWKGGDGIWQNGEGAYWKCDKHEAEAFLNGVGAKFADASGGKVTLSGTLEASNVTIGDGKWTWTSDDTNDVLTVTGTLTVKGGTSLTVDGDGDKGEITLNGDVSVEGGAKLRVLMHGTGNDMSLTRSAEKKMNVTGTLEVSFDENTGGTDGEKVYGFGRLQAFVTGATVNELLLTDAAGTPKGGVGVNFENDFHEMLSGVTTLTIGDRVTARFNDKGTLELTEGGQTHTLQLEGGSQISFGVTAQVNWNVTLSGGSALATAAGQTGTLNGTLTLNSCTLTVGTGTVELGEKFAVAQDTTGTISVAGGATLQNAREGLDLGKVEVNLNDGGKLNVAAALTLSGLDGGAGSTITGDGKLTLKDTEGTFGGTVSSALVYDAAEGSYVITAFDGGKDLTVQSGTLTVTDGTIGTATVTGTLNLDNGTVETANVAGTLSLGSGGVTMANVAGTGTLSLGNGAVGTAEVAGKLSLGGGTVGTLSGVGTLEVTGQVALNGAGDNGIGTLTVGGMGTFTANGNLDVGTVGGTGSVVVGEGKTLTVTGWTDKLTGLTLGGGAVLDLSAVNTRVSIGTLTGGGASAVIVIGDVFGGKNGLTLAFDKLEGQLTLDVSRLTLKDLQLDENGYFVYQLFVGDWDKSWLKNIVLDPEGVEGLDGMHLLILTEGGALQYHVLDKLVWRGTDGIWDYDEKAPDMDDWVEGYFESGKGYNVSFPEVDAALKKVQISGAIAAGDMEVSAGGYSFTAGGETGSSLSVNSLSLTAEGSSTTFGVGTTVNGALTGKGNLVLEGSMSVKDALNAGEGGYTGTITLQGGTLTASGAATVTVGDKGGTLSGAGNGLTAGLSGNGNLTARGTLELGGTLGGQLQVDGGATVSANGLRVGGVSGNGKVSGGMLTVTGTGGSFGGAVEGLSITVDGGASQAFTGDSKGITQAEVEQGGALTVATGTVETAKVAGTLSLGSGGVTMANVAGTGTLSLGNGAVGTAEVAGKLSLGGGTVGTLSGGGTLEVTGKVELEELGDTQASHSIGTLNVGTGGALTVSGNLDVTTMGGGAGNVAVAGGKTLTVNGWTGKLTGLTLGDGATLDLSSVKTEVGIGTLRGGEAPATIVIGDVFGEESGQTLAFDNLGGQLTLKVSELTLGEKNLKYQLFRGKWEETWWGSVELDTEGVKGLDGTHLLLLTKGGELQYHVLDGLVWSGNSTDGGIWKLDDKDTNDWQEGYFDAWDAVNFTGEGNELWKWDVKVSGEIVAGDMTVSDGGYNFTANNETGDSLTVENLKLLLVPTAGEKAATFGVDTTVKGKLTGERDLVLTGRMHVRSALSTEGDNSYTGAITLGQGGILEASGAVKEVKAAGGTLNGTGNDGLTAEKLSGTGDLTAQGKLTLKSGEMGGTLRVSDATVTITDGLSIGGLSGSGTVNGGTLTVTGKGSFGGTVSVVDITVGKDANQAFTGSSSISGTAEVTGMLSLGDVTVGTLSGAGRLEVTGNVTLGADSGIGMLTAKSGTLTVNGNLGVGTMVGGAGSVALAGGKTLTVNEWRETLSGFTLGDKATLDLSRVNAGVVGIGTLRGAGSTATVVIGDVSGKKDAGKDGLQIVLGGLEGFEEGKLTLDVKALTLGETSFEYQLFGTGWTPGWENNIELYIGRQLDGSHVLKLTESGLLSYHVLDRLVWSDDASNDKVWAADSDTSNWEEGYFERGKGYNVSFPEVGGALKEVQISGAIDAGGMEVSAGGYSFTANSETGGSLTVTNLRLTAEGSSTTFGVDTTVTGALTGVGNLVLKGGMSVKDALDAGEGGYTGTITLQGGTLTASGAVKEVSAEGGTLNGTGDGGLRAEKLSGTGDLTAQGKLTLQSGEMGGMLQVNGAVTITDRLSIGGLSGGGTVSGNITVTGGGGGNSFSGDADGLTITVGENDAAKAEQTFTGGKVGITSANVKEQSRLRLGGGTVGALSGAGTLEVTGQVTLSGGGGSIGTLEVTKGGEFTVGKDLRVTAMGGGEGRVAVADGGKLTANGWTGKLSELTLGGGATLDLRGVNAKNVAVGIGTLAGTNATIVIGDVSTKTAGKDGVQLDIGGLTFEQLTLDVNALDVEKLALINGHWEYQLFGDGWNAEWLKFIKLNTSGLELDGRHVVRLTGDGKLQYIAMPGLVWSGESADGGVWAVEGNDTSDWLGGGYFENGDDVGFTGDGIGVPDVQVSGALEVGDMVVTAGGYSFTVQEGGEGTLTVENLQLLAEAGSGTSFGVATTVRATLSGTGDLVLTGKMHVGNALSTEGGNSYTGAITLGRGGELEASGTVKEVKAEGGTLSGTGNGLTAALSGSGDLTARGKLTLSGAMGGVLKAEGDNPSLVVSGGLRVGGLDGSGKVSGGSLAVTGAGGNYGGTLDVTGLTKSGDGRQSIGGDAKVGGDVSVGGGELSLGGKATVSGAVSVSGGALSLNGGAEVNGEVNVSKGGLALGGTVELRQGAEVKDGGTLTLRSADTTLGTGKKLTVGAGSSLALDFGGETWNHGENRNIDIELAGGKLDMSRLTGNVNGQEVHLESLGGTGGSLVWGGGLTDGKRQTVHVGELRLESGTLDLGTVAAGQELHLEQLKDVKGEISGAQNGGKVYLGNVTQKEGTSGAIDVAGGVHVHSHGGTSDGFRKQGAGSFTLKSQLLVDAGKLYVNYDGTLMWGADGSIDGSAQALGGSEIGVTSGVTLKYTDQSKLLLLGVGLFEGFRDPKTLNLDLTETDFSRLSDGFDLGIVSTENNADLLTQLTGVIDLDDIEFGKGEDGTAGYFELSWHEEANGTYHLYLDIVGEFSISEPEWDMAWGDGLIGAPSNKDMEDHTWDGTTGDPFKYNGATEVGEFTGHALELGNVESLHIDGRHTLIRLTQGAAKAGEATAATVVGGIIVDNADDPKSLYYDSYIEYNAVGDKDHLHLLVGGSCCVDSTGGGDGAYASFEGTSHIQVESGTVDYIVGGNHVNNSTFTFKGNSYISVLGGQVLGSIVGGSTLTKGTSRDDLYAFNGDTHIFIYKALGGAREGAPAISDGIGGGATFAAVVGGNAWVDFGTTEGQGMMKPQYFGHTHITVDLVNPVHKGDTEVQIAGRETGVFEKSIVGGNYTAALEAPSDATERNTVFRGDTHITIAAKDATWERAGDGTLSLTGGHVFTKGVAGASRRASSGGGTTDFEGDTHIDITGGMYREAIVGGMWFEESATGGHALTFTGNTEVTLHSGQFWRVVGGSYSLGGAAGASETTVGDTLVTIEGGSFDSAYGTNGGGQADIGIVMGGDFYRHDGGDSNVRTGNTQLNIKGGTFRDVHIVGGDYANFSGTEGKGNASITGASKVEIGGGDITGVVVGGSYLTDEGAGGQLSVGSVELTVSGGKITHESSEAHAHHALAVVGGNMLIDNGGAHGGHNLVVGNGQELGSVNLSVSGGTIVGSVVGGSYTSDHEHGGEANNDGRNNVLAAGNITLNLSGGRIEGSVYGGHYSEVQDHSDVLVLGDITLNVDGEGVSVTGDIVGGSYRAAKSGLAEGDIPAEWGAQDKGSIVLNLKRGTVAGNVWGAGYHAATEAGANPLASETESVTVNLGAGFAFAGTDQILSGGYHKGSNAGHDRSTVRNAVLNLTDSKGYNLSGVTVRDFDVVNTGADVTVRELVLTEDTAANFTKNGAGVLTVQGNLTAAQGVYGGTIHVNGGRLVVGGEVKLGGGLEVTLTAGVGTSVNDAYLAGGSIALQRPEGGKLGLSARFGGEPTEDYAGRYYLATGLQGIEGTEAADWFETGWVAGLAEQLNTAEKSYTGQLRFVGESLVLYLESRDANTWYWDGTGEGGGMTWQGSDPGNWQLGTEEAPEGSKPNEAPEVYFTQGGEGDVHVQGEVTPGAVVVESGTYTFTGDGSLRTGKVEVREGASLDLQVRTKDVKEFDVKGRLVFSKEVDVKGSQVNLSTTGTLGFGEDESKLKPENGDGQLVPTELTDEQVTVNGEGPVSVQVGKTWEEYLAYVAETGQETQGYVGPEKGKVLGSTGTGLGSMRENGLTRRAVERGIRKTGRFALTLAWDGTANVRPAAYGINPVAAGKETVLDAPIVAEEGSLIYDVKGDAGTVTVFSDKARVQVYCGAEIGFRQTAGRLDVNGTFETRDPKNSGEVQGLLGDQYTARTVLGSAGDNAEYRLNGDFTGYTGEIEAVGNGTTSVVRVKDAKAIGAAETAEAAHVTLGLSGRSLVFDGAVGELYLAGVKVSGQNLLGGYRRAGKSDPNAAISLHGKVSGDGVLANARGTDAGQTAYHHTLTGDLSGFTGKIAAGLETGDAGGTSDSSWTLNLAATEGAYSFGVSGTGKVAVKAEGDITLGGVVGGDGNTVSLENAGKGSITLAGKNTSTGTLVTGDGSFVLDGEGAEWAGNALSGNGTLTLKRGTLTHTGGMSEARSRGIVVDATGKVDVNGTQSDKLGNITVHGGGRLANVVGDLGTSDRLVRLEFGAKDLDAGAEGLISFAGTPGTLAVTQGDAEHTTTGEPQSGLVLDFTAEGFVDLLKKHAAAGNETELRVVQNGGLDITGLEGGKDLLRVLTAGGGYGGLLSALGFTLNADRAAEGILALNGRSDRVYLVLEKGEAGGDPGDVKVGTNSGELEGAGAVVVDQNSELALHFTAGSGDSDVVLHNLVGLENASLTVRDERTGEEKAAGDAWVKLENQLREDLSGSELGNVSDGKHTVNTDKSDGFDVRGVDTIFEGTVRSADETVNIEKSGSGRMTLGSAVSGKGGLDMKGELRLSGGGITLQGNATGSGNAAGNLAFAYTGDAGSDAGLSLKNGADMTVHDITEEGKGAGDSVRGGEVTLGKDSVFTLDNSGKLDANGAHVGTDLRDTVFRAERDAEGKPAEGAKLAVTGTGAGSESHSQLSFDGAKAGVNGADLEVSQGAKVTAQNGAVLKDGDITLTGDGSTLKVGAGTAVTGDGNIAVKDGGQLALENGGRLGGDGEAFSGDIALSGKGSTLTVGEGSRFETSGKVTVESGSTLGLGTSAGNRAGSFSGNGTLSGNAGSTLTVTGPGEGTFNGTLAGGGGMLSVGNGGSLTLENVDTQAAWDLGIEKGGNLKLRADGKGMSFGDIELAGGGSLTLGNIGKGLSGNLQVDSSSGAKGKLSVDVGDGKGDVELGTLKLQDKNGRDLTEGNVGSYLDVGFTGAGASHFDASLQQNRDGTWFVGLQRVLKNTYLRAGMHKNVRAGANLMWDVDDARSAAFAYVNGAGATGDLARLNYAVMQYYNNDGTDIGALLMGMTPMENPDRTYAAVAGSSTSVLGVAGLQEVKRQLESVRNRASMSGDATVNADPGTQAYSVWMNAETAYHKADADGWAPGYTLNGWGGSIGGCTRFAHGLTAGLVLTAMYNDLKTEAADSGTGDFDVTYVSGYVRLQHGAWSHTLAATCGAADITLNRTVNYAAGSSYRVHGDTDGYTMGLMYEVTRSMNLNEKGSMVLQPVFNAQLRHAEADGYNETGSDAGLHVDDIDATVVTFGLGARLQSAISENAFGRRAVVETRLLAKADAGDSEGQTTNRLLHGTLAQEVESADTGKYGVEVGVGMTIPVGSRGGAVFLDGSMEVRENYQEYNAGIGYKINF